MTEMPETMTIGEFRELPEEQQASAAEEVVEGVCGAIENKIIEGFRAYLFSQGFLPEDAPESHVLQHCEDLLELAAPLTTAGALLLRQQMGDHPQTLYSVTRVLQEMGVEE